MSSVNHPTHYATKSGVEVIDITRHLSNNLGNAVKYMLRAGKKGDAKEDLAKAAWYLVDECQCGISDYEIPQIIRWKCVKAALALEPTTESYPTKHLLLRMATGSVSDVDMVSVALVIHHSMGLCGKDLPHGYNMDKMCRVVLEHGMSDVVNFVGAENLKRYTEPR